MKHKGRSRTEESLSKSVALRVFAVFILLLSIPFELFAKPVNSAQVEKTVKGWLNADAAPLNTALGGQVSKIDVYNGIDGQPAYYIVYLKPSGFVIVSADDAVEPIIGFAASGTYDTSTDNFLTVLVERDIPKRVAEVRRIEKEIGGNDKLLHDMQTKAKDKWNNFQAYADEQRLPMGLGSISDVRVSPLVQSQWNQSNVSGSWCYNYYTPNHYVCGCVATAMAQLMRFHQYPTDGIGVHPFTISVGGVSQTASTRGGDGSGGPYNWSQMPLVPASGVNDTQRQAIGALCYDAGVAVKMMYASGGSGAYMSDAKDALLDTFGYSNVVYGSNYSSSNIGVGLNAMVNPNLDAGYPVIFGIEGPTSAHAVVGDGYGYSGSTLYHHINMGWGGSQDAWYNLPNINSSPYYDTIDSCIYNVFTSGLGEIISGCVTDDSGSAVSGATVTAVGTFDTYTAVTNSNGIYALTKVFPLDSYNITVSKAGFSFASQDIDTGFSVDWEDTSGNVWGVDFQGTQPGCNGVTIGTGTNTWDYPMHTYYHDSRTQVIYLASEIGNAGTIKSLSLNVATIPGQVMNNWTIRMKHTISSVYNNPASFEPIDSGWKTVYQANEPQGSTGWRKFTFTTPFDYNGTSNLLIDFSHNNSSYTSSGYCYYSTPGGIRSAYAYSDSAYGDPLSWTGTSSPSVYSSINVPNIKLTICEASPLEADLNGDNGVDMLDYAILAAQWQQSPGVPSADIAPPGGDDVIDYQDLAVMVNQWLQGI